MTVSPTGRGDSAESRRGISISHRFAIFPPAVAEPEIVLKWVVRLRWLALAGQGVAAGVAVAVLGLKLPLAAIGGIIALTGLSNLILQIWTRRHVPPWVVPAVLMLDVCLLTGLLLCAGGAANPFSALYLVHVAMAVVTLGEGWSWLVVLATTACYGLLFLLRPARPLALSAGVSAMADWIALVLVSILIAYFVGRMTRSLRRHEKALVDARERGARNEQLASLTTLSAGAAHELNTPLSTIAVVARELEVQSKQMELNESFAADARLIRQEVDRCKFILDRMRVDVLRGESPRQTPMRAAEFVAGLREDLKSVAGEELKIECGAEVKEVTLPPRAVRQAVGILVDNAMDASPKGKGVGLSIHGRNGHIVFEVKDEGTGMSPEVMRRAGEPFFTTKAPGEGMGLGLFLVRLVAERLGGSLRFESETGKGTRAILELPGH